jgi:predicted enzyme related to lactoylglutathione lyase
MKSIEVISVPVSDQQKSKDFYLKLGFEVIIESQMGPDQTWLQMGFPGAPVSITLVNWFRKMPPGSMQGLVLKTEDIAAEVEALEAKGVKVAPIDQTPWGKFAEITDPDGNTMTLHE